MFEGGIHVPFTVKWPAKIKPGKTNHVSAFHDFMPTVCELVGVETPAASDGISYLPTLMGREEQKKHDFIYWEFIKMSGSMDGKGVQAMLDVRRNLKVIRQGIGAPLEIYDLEADTAEANNIAGQKPELAQVLAKQLDTMRGPSELWPVSWFTFKGNSATGKTANKKKGRK